jgi:putative FmdB family regulatory protein
LPLFDFRCRSCRQEFEALVRPDDPAPVCRHCGSHELERLLPQVAISTEAQTARNVRSARVKARGAHRDRIEYQKEIEEKHRH